MRYCAHCGHIIDEYDIDRNSFNCGICDAILLEDDMTALKYTELSEQEKDEYEQQLLKTIKNSIGFDEGYFQMYCSMENGDFWVGFRIDKYARYNSKEDVEFYTNIRKSNEPFKPFPPIDKEKARAYTHSTSNIQKQENSNKVTCPFCKSTNVRKIGSGERAVSVLGLGLLSKKINKSFKCNSCGGTF
ncbi:MAG: IS1 family transposase [Coprococcus sp.]|nr:IS1 family transposase [Coprococcus sp.]